jgi:hypothetical protein
MKSFLCVWVALLLLQGCASQKVTESDKKLVVDASKIEALMTSSLSYEPSSALEALAEVNNSLTNRFNNGLTKRYMNKPVQQTRRIENAMRRGVLKGLLDDSGDVEMAYVYSVFLQLDDYGRLPDRVAEALNFDFLSPENRKDLEALQSSDDRPVFYEAIYEYAVKQGASDLQQVVLEKALIGRFRPLESASKNPIDRAINYAGNLIAVHGGDSELAQSVAAAAAGSGKGLLALSMAFENGSNGLEKNDRRAFDYLIRAADVGYQPAQTKVINQVLSSSTSALATNPQLLAAAGRYVESGSEASQKIRLSKALVSRDKEQLAELASGGSTKAKEALIAIKAEEVRYAKAQKKRALVSVVTKANTGQWRRINLEELEQSIKELDVMGIDPGLKPFAQLVLRLSR